MKIFPKILIGAALLLSGIGPGYFWGFNNEQAVLNSKLKIIHPLRENSSEYNFISPLLAYIIPSADQEPEIVSLKNKVNDYINGDIKNNNVSDASVFFYDLNRGRWTGVNAIEKYSPASMLKVVIMVAYFKDSEENPNMLNKYLTYTKEIDDVVKQDPFNTLSDLKIGSSYEMSDLINKMIINSDNGAQFLLLSNINQASLDYIYNVLNIENPSGKNDFTISPRAYSLFFRILYSSTYLNNSDSEKALSILSKTTFDDGIIAGVPKGVTVSHKFGEHVMHRDDQAFQGELHDCGIVYYPKNPYLLCIMTKGGNLDALKSTIKNISNIVYQNYATLK